MSEDQNNDVNAEVVEPVSEEASVEQSQQKQKDPEKGSAEYNFRELRKVAEQQQREIYELKNQLSSKQQSQQKAVEAPSNLDDDDYVTVKMARNLGRKEAEEILQQREVDLLEDRMRIRFKDYDDVVTEDNVKQLVEDDHDIAETIRNAPNPYATTYKLIKKAGFFEKKAEPKKKHVEAERIEKNAVKPMSSNSVQSKAISGANQFSTMSKEQMQELSREMAEYASRRY